jgi:adenylate cyclase
LQDEVVASIVGTLPGRVEAAAHERSQRNPTKDMRAYEYVLAAKVLHHRSRREDNIEAQRLIEKAIELDPNYAHAHAWRGCIVGQAWTYNWGTDPEVAKETVISELNTARSLDDNDPDVHRILAAIALTLNNFDAAIHHQERALSLNPNNDLIVVQYGEVLTWLGEPEAGIPWILKAMRLNPHHPERFWNHLGRAHFVARDYKSAITAFKRITKPDQFHHAFLAAAHAMDGDQAAAAMHAKAVLSLDPAFTVESYMSTLHYEKTSDSDHHREALLKAGLPM